MAEYLLTYDVSKRHPEVKTALENKGFMDKWEANKVTYNLPNTTLWKTGDSITIDTVLADMHAVIADLNKGVIDSKKIKLERCMVVPSAPWRGIPGDPHAA